MLNKCGSCAGVVRELCGSCAGVVRELCGSCAGVVRELCGSLFVCLFIWNTKYSNKVRPAGATRIIINATLDIRRFKRYSEMTIYKRPLKNENTPRLVYSSS